MGRSHGDRALFIREEHRENPDRVEARLRK
jgi:hypothetical protein